MKLIHVSCAIIIKTDKILVAQRSENMEHPLLWEFPGGKIELSESAEDCIIREIKEELKLNIKVCKSLNTFNYAYPNKNVVLHPFICKIESGTMLLSEHKSIIWLELMNLSQLEWVPADIEIYKHLINEDVKNIINIQSNKFYK